MISFLFGDDPEIVATRNEKKYFVITRESNHDYAALCHFSQDKQPEVPRDFRRR
jgi:hypothetical protein